MQNTDIVLLEKFKHLRETGTSFLDELISILPGIEAYGIGNFPIRLRALALIEVRKIREKIEEIIIGLNKSYESIQKTLGEELINSDVENEVRLEGYLISPSADGIFTVENSRKFYEWCLKNKGDDVKDIFDFLALYDKKKWLKEICNNCLENGQPLPAGIRPYLRTAVRMRSCATAQYETKE